MIEELMNSNFITIIDIMDLVEHHRDITNISKGVDHPRLGSYAVKITV